MARISDAQLRDWNNGETMFEADYEQERSILKTAINDNYDRLIKKYEVLNADGTLKSTQNLDTAINYVKLKEDSTITLVHDSATSTVQIVVTDGSITTAKLASLGVTTAKIADGNVTTLKIADRAVTTGKVALGAVGLAELNITDIETRFYNETEIDNKLSETAGGQSYSFRSGTTFPTTPVEWDVFGLTQDQVIDGVTYSKGAYQFLGGKWKIFVNSGINKQNTTIPHGLSIIETDQKTPLDIAMDGRTLVNHMGWQGKFGSLFNRWDANLAIDTSVYKFGTSSGKIDNSAGTAAKLSLNTQKMYLDGKYAVIGFWAKGASGTPDVNMAILGYDSAGAVVESRTLRTLITNSLAFYYTKVDLTTTSTDHWKARAGVVSFGTVDDVVNFDGMIAMPLTQAQYNEIDILTSDEVAEKYGYVNSVKHIQNPVVVSYGKQLLPPFTEWNLHANATVIEPYKLELNATAGSQKSTFTEKCLPSTTYTVIVNTDENADVRWAVYEIKKDGTETQLFAKALSQATTITTSSNVEKLRVEVYSTVAGTFTFTNPQLELGSVATTFEVQNKTYLYGKDVKLGSNLDGSVADQLIDRNSMLKRFELDKVLDGSLGWAFDADFVSYKRIQLPFSNAVAQQEHSKLVKYDGKIAPRDSLWTSGDQHNLASSYLYITISDTDSGWTDAMTPTANMIKGYFNGWKYTGDGTTHSWAQINDATVTSTSDTFVADPANSHVDWTPYELSYQLADSIVEPVTMEGALNLIEGLNQVSYEEGVIVRELANPKQDSVTKDWYINDVENGDVPSGSELDYAPKEIIEIYKNDDPDNNWTVFDSSIVRKQKIARIENDLFDTTAQYTVTYTVLDKHLFTANAIEATGQYNTNLKTVVDKHTDQIADLNTKQSQQDIWNDSVAVKGEGEKVQSGADTITGDGTRLKAKTITFPKAFSEIPKIAVLPKINSLTPSYSSVTTTSFTVVLNHIDNLAWSSTYEFNWIAIGK
jgi:hypothetical protein